MSGLAGMDNRGTPVDLAFAGRHAYMVAGDLHTAHLVASSSNVQRTGTGHSLKTLTAGLGNDSQPLEAVLDNSGDVTAYQVALSSGTPGCSLSGIAADGTADSDGLCVIMTDAQADSAVIEGALAQAKAAIDTENFTFIVMANGMAGSSPCSQEALADGLAQLLKKLGFQNSLKACS